MYIVHSIYLELQLAVKRISIAVKNVLKTDGLNIGKYKNNVLIKLGSRGSISNFDGEIKYHKPYMFS